MSILLNAANKARTFLTGDIDSEETSFAVNDVSLFPEHPFRVTVDNEIMEVSEVDPISGMFMQVERGVEGTIAENHSQGAPVENRFTAGMYQNIINEIKTHKSNIATHVKPARLIVGASTAGWTTKDCHFLCDGMDDQVEINAAVQALPATGGEIVILDGVYNITAKVYVDKNNVLIRGNGGATVLKRMWDSTVEEEGVITFENVSGCGVSDISIDGNKAYFSNNRNCGVQFKSCSSSIISGVICSDCGYGIMFQGGSGNVIMENICKGGSRSNIYLLDTSECVVFGNILQENNGIYVYANNNLIACNGCNNNYNGIVVGGSNNIITSNTCNDNLAAIQTVGNSSMNAIIGNTCNNGEVGIQVSGSQNTFQDNVCIGNEEYGIDAIDGDSCVISSNLCSNNYNGIRASNLNKCTIVGNVCNDNSRVGILLLNSNRNNVTGNTCMRGTGIPDNYAPNQYTIHLRLSGNNYNLISSNICMGKAVTIDGGTGNTEINNKYE